jgi:branched-chain amino acid transport system substrate-binding protein
VNSAKSLRIAELLWLLRLPRRMALVRVGLIILFAQVGALAFAAEPIRIGFGMALTGGLAGNGTAALLAIQIWAEEANAKGGLLGRPIKLVYYDDQTNPSLVPGIYSKLIEVDKVDLVIAGYGTNVEAPAMPIIISRGMMFMGLFGLEVNKQFNYDRFFQIQPMGPNPRQAFSEGFFAAAMTMEPQPKTLALTGADAEYPQVAMVGVRELAARHDIKIVYDRSYPPNLTDFTPIVRSIQATNPDLVYVASYPPDTAGMVNAAHELNLKTRMFGGGMVGLQFSSIKKSFGSKLNGIVYYNHWVPEPTMMFPGMEDFLTRYQARAAAAGVDPLGHYLPPFAYAAMQVIAQAVEATRSLDQKTLAEHMHRTTFKTIVGDVTFGADGEWTESRVIYTQARGIVGNDIEQYKKPGKEVIIWPDKYQSGKLEYPYSDVKH